MFNICLLNLLFACAQVVNGNLKLNAGHLIDIQIWNLTQGNKMLAPRLSTLRSIVTRFPHRTPAPRPLGPAPKPAPEPKSEIDSVLTGTDSSSVQKKPLPSQSPQDSSVTTGKSHRFAPPGRGTFQFIPPSPARDFEASSINAGLLSGATNDIFSMDLVKGTILSASTIQETFRARVETRLTPNGQSQASIELSTTQRQSISTRRRLTIPENSSETIDSSASPTPKSMPPLETPPADEVTSFTFTMAVEQPMSSKVASGLQKELVSTSVSVTKSHKISNEEFLAKQKKLDELLRARNMELVAQDWRMADLGIQHPKKEHRVDHVRAYVMQDIFVREHLSQFLRGACRVVSKYHIEKFQQYGSIGHSADGSMYLTTVEAVLKIIKESGGSMKAFKQKLGVPHWKDEWEIFIDVIHNPEEFGLSMPGGDEPTANDNFAFGGYTQDQGVVNKDVPEATTREKIPPTHYTRMSVKQFREIFASPKAESGQESEESFEKEIPG